MFRREEEKVNTILLQLCLKKTKQAACQLICAEQHFLGPHFLIFLLFNKQNKSDLLAYNNFVSKGPLNKRPGRCFGSVTGLVGQYFTANG